MQQKTCSYLWQSLLWKPPILMSGWMCQDFTSQTGIQSYPPILVQINTFISSLHTGAELLDVIPESCCEAVTERINLPVTQPLWQQICLPDRGVWCIFQCSHGSCPRRSRAEICELSYMAKQNLFQGEKLFNCRNLISSPKWQTLLLVFELQSRYV